MSIAITYAYKSRNQCSYKKLNVKFKNIQEHFWGENTIFQEHFRRVIRTFYLQYTINTAILSRETKSLTEVGALKNMNNGYYRNIGTPFERSPIEDQT